MIHIIIITEVNLINCNGGNYGIGVMDGWLWLSVIFNE